MRMRTFELHGHTKAGPKNPTGSPSRGTYLSVVACRQGVYTVSLWFSKQPSKFIIIHPRVPEHGRQVRLTNVLVLTGLVAS